MIPDDALIVRGELDRPADIERGTATHPSGITTPRVFADFHNADGLGRVRLNCVGTIRDLADQGIQLREGLLIYLDSEELATEGLVRYSAEERLWVAVVDWGAIKRRSE